MKAKKNSAKKVAKPVAAKKPVAKAKPVKKPVAAKKVVAKKPVAKAKAVSPAKKPVAAKKPAAKPSKPAAKSSSGFSIKAAAAKLKSALTTKKPEPKPVKKAAAPVVAKKQPAPAPAPAKKPVAVPVAAPVVKAAAKPAAPEPTLKAVVRPEAPVKPKKIVNKSNYVSPKGVLTEEQIRKSHDRDYMSDSQLEFFRHRLLQMRNEVLERELDVKERLHQREVFADPADRATAEEEHWLDLRLRERESLLLHKVDDALRRIADREYGYCEKTGDAIGIPRLLARPTATVCVDVKGQDERIESQFRDR